MDQVTRASLSPYRMFSIEQWAKLRADTPMTLAEEDVAALRSLGDPVSMQEVERVYVDKVYRGHDAPKPLRVFR